MAKDGSRTVEKYFLGLFFFFVLRLVLDDFTWFYYIAKKDYFMYWEIFYILGYSLIHPH